MGYLMKKNEMTMDEALSHLQSRRPVVQPNDAFLAQLRKYESSLNAKRAEEASLAAKFNGQSRGSDSRHVGVSIGPSFPPPDDSAVAAPADPQNHGVVLMNDSSIGPAVAPVSGPCDVVGDVERSTVTSDTTFVGDEDDDARKRLALVDREVEVDESSHRKKKNRIE
jgi:hypothetical protein